MAESGTHIKITCVGDGYVGKTSLLYSYSLGKFPQTYIPTVFESQVVRATINNETHIFNLFDTAGQEDWDTLRVLAYPTTDVLLLCFTIAAPDSLRNIKDKWMPEIIQHIPDVPIVLVGTKCDLRVPENINSGSRTQRFVSTIDGERLRREIKAYKYIECSACTMMNINKVFETCAEAYHKSKITVCKRSSIFSCFRGQKD